MKRMTLILSVLCAALLMTAAVMAEDLFSGTENEIAVSIAADDFAKLADAENTDAFTGIFTINGAAADGTIRRASRAEMQAPAPQGERPEGKGEPPADGERPEGKNEPPADGERPEGKNEPPADGERPEGMPEMISYVISIDGSEYLLLSMPEMPEDAPEKPADAPEKPEDVPEMPEQIGGTLSINGESKGSISIMALA